jgi:hypothetical protein
MGGEALGPVKVLCPSTGEYQGRNGSGWAGEQGDGERIGGFAGETRKGDNILNVNKENI